MASEMKYPTYEALAKAFKSGELSDKEWVLVLDNDSCHLSYIGPVPPGVDECDYREKMYERARKWFCGGGYGDLEDAVRATGIPCEWC